MVHNRSFLHENVAKVQYAHPNPQQLNVIKDMYI